jgi:hypothetical protein
MALVMVFPPPRGEGAVRIKYALYRRGERGGGVKRYEVNKLRTAPHPGWGQTHYKGHWKGYALFGP